MLIKALRWLRGYVEFSVYGVYPQRFLNNALRAALSIWDVEPIKHGFRGKIYGKDYRKIHKLAKGCYLRTKVLKRKGLPFFLGKHKKRWGLAIGLVAILAIFMILGQMIWLVEVNGGEDIDHNEVKSHLQQMGLGPGTWRRAVVADQLERELMLREKRIGWVAINVKGGRVEVEIHQRSLPPEVVDVSGAATNVVASETGYVKEMEIYEGQPVVNIGDVVMKGDIIVSGVTLDKHGNTQLKQARAVVVGQVRSRLEVEIPLEMVTTEAVGEGIAYKYLVLWGLRVPIAGAKCTFEDYVTELSSQPLFLDGAISLETKRLIPVEQITTQMTIEDAEGVGMQRLREKERNVFRDAEITENEYSMVEQGNSVLVIGEYIIEKDIGATVEIITD